MKKIFIVLFSAFMVLGFSSIVLAENFADGTYRGLQEFRMFRNSGSSTITSNSVVILDVSTGEAGSSLGMNVTVSSSATAYYQVGVTDEDIAAGAIGRVCVGGPHLVKQFSGTAAISAGANVGPSSKGSGYAGATTGTSTTNGQIGTALAAKNTTNSQDMWWVWVNPTTQ